MQVKKFFLLALISLFLVIGCGGGGSSSGGDGGTLVGAGGTFVNSTFAPTVRQCDLLLDGTVIATQTYATPASGCASLVGTATIGNGNHTLSFRITNQSTSPNSYKTMGVLVTAGPSVKYLADKTQILATGQSISFTFVWP